MFILVSPVVEQEVLIDLRFPFVNVVEDDCYGSVGSRRACLRNVVFGNAASHSVVAFIALRHPPENPYCISDEGSRCKDRGSHGEGSRTALLILFGECRCHHPFCHVELSSQI